MQRRLFLVLMVLAFAVTTTAQEELDTNLKIAFVSNQEGNEDIFVMPWDGSRTPTNLTRNPARDWNPAWSPDGAQIIFNSDRDGSKRIYVMNQNGTRLRPLIQDGGGSDDVAPAWSPDSQLIVFVSNRGGIGWDLFTVTPDGQNLNRLTNNRRIIGDPAWSPDNQSVVYWELQQDGQIFLFKLNVANLSRQLLTTAGQNGMAVWSPDGRMIYFDSDRTGEWGVYSMLNDGALPTRITPDDVNSGRATVSPDGTRMIFVSDRDESDELYLANIDGSREQRLTDNLASDHSPAWQPAVPQETLYVDQAPTSEAAEPTPTPALGQVSVGQSVNGFEVDAIELDTLLVDYGIKLWHDNGWTGAGRKVAVMDTGFGGILDLENTYQLNIQVKPGDDLNLYHNELNSHGTSVMEIIHKVAPGAELYACKYDGTYEQFEACIKWLRDVEVNIINHSAGLPALPLDGSNLWAAQAEDLYKANILWVNSAGNFNQGFRAENFTDSNGDNHHEFVTGSQNQDLLRVERTDYRGNIMLTWVSTTQYNSQTETEEQVDFDLEIVSLSSGNVISASTREQRNDPTLSTSELINLSANEAFGIRIKNVGLPVNTNVEMLLFVEFYQIPGAEISGSVIAPGDARDSLTVGSVQSRSQTLAAYSSRGVRSTNQYDKPDLSAPGEFIIGGDTFIGTSAAAPVVAGAAALLWEADTSYFTDTLKAQLIASVNPSADKSYGSGVFLLPPPSSTNIISQLDVNVEPKTVFPQPDVSIVPTPPPCIGAVTSRLAIGARGYVSYNLGLAIRGAPSLNGADLGNLYLGVEFTVVGGPVCDAGLNWWEVRLDDGSPGFMAEGGSYYFLSPVNLERAQLPDNLVEACPLAAPSLFEVGERAQVVNAPAGGLTIWRNRGQRNVIDTLANGVQVHILGGPICEGEDDNIRRWYVRVLTGRDDEIGIEGWISESATGVRWLDIIQ